MEMSGVKVLIETDWENGSGGNKVLCYQLSLSICPSDYRSDNPRVPHGVLLSFSRADDYAFALPFRMVLA
jgi:hypothetical protein